MGSEVTIAALAPTGYVGIEIDKDFIDIVNTRMVMIAF